MVNASLQIIFLFWLTTSSHTHTDINVCCCSYYLLNFMKAILEMEFNGARIFSSMTNIIFKIYAQNSGNAMSTDNVHWTGENFSNSFLKLFYKKENKMRKLFRCEHIFLYCLMLKARKPLETYHFQSIFVLCAANLFFMRNNAPSSSVCEWMRNLHIFQ